MTLVYDKWIEHDGRSFPVPVGYLIDFIAQQICGTKHASTLVSQNWVHWIWSECDDFRSRNPNEELAKITHYLIHKPKGAEKLEAMLNDLPEEVDA